MRCDGGDGDGGGGPNIEKGVVRSFACFYIAHNEPIHTAIAARFHCVQRIANQTENFLAIDFRKCDLNGSYQKFSYQNKVHNFAFFVLFKALFIIFYWFFRCLNAWIAAICLSAIFCLPQAFNLFGFPIKIAEADKEVLNECTSDGADEKEEQNRGKNRTNNGNVEVAWNSLRIDVLQQKYLPLTIIIMTYQKLWTAWLSCDSQFARFRHPDHFN